MKLLIISAFPPNQMTAGQDYTRRMILDLIEKKHQVFLIYADYPKHTVELPDSVIILKKIKPKLRNCLTKFWIHPFFTRRYETKLTKYIRNIANQFDVVYFDFSQVHLYSLYVDHPKKVLMCHDIIVQKFTRKGKWQLPFIMATEKRILKSANSIFTLSKKDSDLIKKYYQLTSKTVNIYLKTGEFSYEGINVEKNKFCFYGAWNRSENNEALTWFLKNVQPFVSRKIQFIILGGGMEEILKKKIIHLKYFKVLGFVEDPIKEIASCQALIAPLHKGAGIKVKVIDALSCGTSVIGTDVAFEGIEDNKKNKLFYKCNSRDEYISLLNEWKNVNKEIKQDAANEFLERYDTNHFSDIFLIESVL